MLIDDLLPTCRAALSAADSLIATARGAVNQMVSAGGRVDAAKLDANQFAAHGYAWYATYGQALRQILAWAERLEAAGRLGTLEQLILQAAYGEYLAQITGGIAMSQVEIVRPGDLGIDDQNWHAFYTPEVARLIGNGNSAAVRAAIADIIADGTMPDPDLDDEMLIVVRDQFRRFSDERIAPDAQDWHREDRLIPDAVVAEMAELGVFGLTVPEAWGGSGMGKVAMCVVTEELCRGSLAVGSLATRSEIAAELIRVHGTEAQKERWLGDIASGKVLPTAVFTEPDTGSDLGSLKTRAARNGDVYQVTGAKTWTTHGARADLMTLLARTDPDQPGYKGLSMLLAPKPRGTDAAPFPADGMEGGEINVLGYRGMKEYEIAFDGFEVPADCLLGEKEGEGFKQLMATFESARIQTAARATGVAQSAFELGLAYAQDRMQFGRPIFEFPRVSGKLAWMLVETMVARQLTWFAAREKDAGHRCDLEAGMAKLLAARVAWASADNAVQIHGGNGYAEEYPVSRVLVDSRILNVFEGAAEIQAHIIARRLLGGN
ncbi:MAG: acyl-CoA dehydrogenase family protein [Alphaproteobacteria bacterium]